MSQLLRAILFDLDNTLYHPDCGLQEAGDRRFNRWIAENLGMSPAQADALRVRTWRQYGATARGLQAEFGVDPREVYEYAVNGLAPDLHLQPWPELGEMLARLPVARYVFTNATGVYADKVLRSLGVREQFNGIFDIEDSGWLPKPAPGIYRNIVSRLGLAPSQIALVEDNPANLLPAKDLGMLAVLVGEDGTASGCDLQVAGILELDRALREAGVMR